LGSSRSRLVEDVRDAFNLIMRLESTFNQAQTHLGLTDVFESGEQRSYRALLGQQQLLCGGAAFVPPFRQRFDGLLEKREDPSDP
jgi:hypothetical protein